MSREPKNASCLAVWRGLASATRTVENHVRRSVEAKGLNYSDFKILDVLRERGPLPVNAIGEEVGLTSGSITTAIDRLSKRGFVARQANDADARSRLVTLKAAGKKLIDGALDEHEAAVSAALNALNATERRSVLDLLEKIAPAPQPDAE